METEKYTKMEEREDIREEKEDEDEEKAGRE